MSMKNILLSVFAVAVLSSGSAFARFNQKVTIDNSYMSMTEDNGVWVFKYQIKGDGCSSSRFEKSARNRASGMKEMCENLKKGLHDPCGLNSRKVLIDTECDCLK